MQEVNVEILGGWSANRLQLGFGRKTGSVRMAGQSPTIASAEPCDPRQACELTKMQGFQGIGQIPHVCGRQAFSAPLSLRRNRRSIRHGDSQAKIALINGKNEQVRHARQIDEAEPVGDKHRGIVQHNLTQ